MKVNLVVKPTKAHVGSTRQDHSGGRLCGDVIAFCFVRTAIDHQKPRGGSSRLSLQFSIDVQDYTKLDNVKKGNLVRLHL